MSMPFSAGSVGACTSIGVSPDVDAVFSGVSGCPNGRNARLSGPHPRAAAARQLLRGAAATAAEIAPGEPDKKPLEPAPRSIDRRPRASFSAARFALCCGPPVGSRRQARPSVRLAPASRCRRALPSRRICARASTPRHWKVAGGRSEAEGPGASTSSQGGATKRRPQVAMKCASAPSMRWNWRARGLSSSRGSACSWTWAISRSCSCKPFITRTVASRRASSSRACFRSGSSSEDDCRIAILHSSGTSNSRHSGSNNSTNCSAPPSTRDSPAASDASTVPRSSAWSPCSTLMRISLGVSPFAC
mmetsp:Transcript_279/g.1186  ORF Transcript_279/g.1186 Transcript_279/m.1186 type:complete len:304 (-) Transcript_279:416-1327(-)